MSEHEFEAYLNLLARTLKLSEAQRQRIAGELRDHLEERMQELVDRGHDRDAAILAALDEFGDANLLAADLTPPRPPILRRRLMQTSFATIAAAALVALAVTYLVPTNYQGAAPQSSALAEQTDDADAKPDVKGAKAGFVYVTGRTKRSGAYTVPGDDALTLQQLIASAGGLVDAESATAVVFNIIRRNPDLSQSIIRLTQQEAMDPATPFYLQANDLIQIELDPRELASRTPDRVILDLLPVLKLATNDQNLESEIGSEWLVQHQNEFAGHMYDVLQGMGHRHGEELGSVSAWMGLLTVVGSPAAISDAEAYFEQTREALERRVQTSTP